MGLQDASSSPIGFALLRSEGIKLSVLANTLQIPQSHRLYLVALNDPYRYKATNDRKPMEAFEPRSSYQVDIAPTTFLQFLTKGTRATQSACFILGLSLTYHQAL